MSWDQARRLFAFSRLVRESEAVEPPLAEPELPGCRPRLARAASLCVASGKGGTGKSVVSASLGAQLSTRGPTLIVDADMGIGNAHIMQGVSPERSFVEVVGSGLSVPEIVTPCGPELDLLAAGSGVSHMAGLTPLELLHIAEGLERLESRYAFLLVDSAAGVSDQTVAFAAACDLVLVVTTPDVTAMTDAYAFIKVLLRARSGARPLLVVNRSRSAEEAEAVAGRMEAVSQKFLGAAPRWVGWVPEDPAVPEAVNGRSPVVSHAPDSPAARALAALATALVAELGRSRRSGLGRTLLREGLDLSSGQARPLRPA